MDNRLLTVTDLNGNTEALANYKDFRIRGKVNGERLLSLFLMPNKSNEHSWPLVKEESIIEYNGQKYRIKKPSERSRGNKTVKIIQAHHIMFDLIDNHQYDVLAAGNKSITTAVQHALANTDCTYEIIGTFKSVYFENFGDDNSLSLLQTIMNRYKAEFDVNNKHIIIKEQIGNVTDFQFRFKHNIKTIQKDIDTSNLTTYIKGYGADGLVVEYTSPNASIFGIRHARPVRDERYTTEAGLLERLKEEINDEPYFSVTLTFAELKKSGYPYEVVELGDETHLIYEPMDDLMMKVRVMEYNEFPEEPLESTVTLGNYKKNAARSQADLQATRNQIELSFVEGRLKSSAMELAVQRASEALNNALTELEFPKGYGIIARNPNNANHFLALNSNGLGITLDGGQTFKEAITTDGFVLSTGVVGTMLFSYLKGGELTLGGSGNENGRMVVLDANGNAVADLDAEYGGFKKLFVDELESNNTITTLKKNITYYVASQDGNHNSGVGTPSDANEGTSWTYPLATIEEALRRIPKYLEASAKVVLEYGGTYYEDVNIYGFMGNGTLTIDGQTKSTDIKGDINVYMCTNRVDLYDFTVYGKDDYSVISFITSTGRIIRVDVYGISSGTSFLIDAVHNSFVQVQNCETYDANHCICARYGAVIMNIDNKGYGLSGGLYTYAGVIMGYGTCPDGGTSTLYRTSGGEIRGGFTADTGAYTAPPPPETKESWNATGSANWREDYGGQWNANNTYPYQGDWDGWGLYKGYWFFGSAPSTAVTGKTIKKMRIYVSRVNAGGYAESTIYFGRHGYTSQPSANPPTSPTETFGIKFARGESKWVELPSSWFADFESGAAKGVGIYTSSYSNAYYAYMGTSATLEITYA